MCHGCVITHRWTIRLKYKLTIDFYNKCHPMFTREYFESFYPKINFSNYCIYQEGVGTRISWYAG